MWGWVSEWQKPCTALAACCQTPSSVYKHLGTSFCTLGFRWGLEKSHCSQTWVASTVSNTSHHSILAFGYSLYGHAPPLHRKQNHQITQIQNYPKEFSHEMKHWFMCALDVNSVRKMVKWLNFTLYLRKWENQIKWF